METAELRGVLFDAARGISALDAFIETRFEMADRYENEGEHEAAEQIRETWTKVWDALADGPRRAILAELHDLLNPAEANEGLVLATNA